MKYKTESPLEARIGSFDIPFSGSRSSQNLYTNAKTPKYKSASEAIVADILEREGIKFTYEDGLLVKDQTNGAPKEKIWHPDFHLHDSDILVEYVGLPDDKEYMKGIEKKKKVYAEMGKTVVWLFPEDVWDNSDGTYRKRQDAEENVLNKIYAGMRAAEKDHGLSYSKFSEKSFDRNIRSRYAAA